jgi:hypothetical protein
VGRGHPLDIITKTRNTLTNLLTMATDTPSVANEDKGREKSSLTSPSESYLEKLSPAPTSIHSNQTPADASESYLQKPSPAPASIHSNQMPAEDTNNGDSENVSDDETQYPPAITKVGVGVALGLVIFLVRISFCRFEFG